MDIRQETEGDIAAIRKVTEAAFALAEHSSGTEAQIVDSLRQSGGLYLSLVAVQEGEVLGHLAFSPIRIAGQECGWLGLGPVSTRPDQQRKGIGKALIEAGLAKLREKGVAGCTVLGDPGYYGRFGFVADGQLHFAGVPPEYFMSLSFVGSTPKGEVTYAPAFYEE
ncbi:GCN5-related N-acetyltransferase [Roseobacter sp. SK209-2-6]|uniref:GNAT family N-acetyltransferase n=1 Tax=Roseobacter sp. SK209-2-6 TaxID=388739 RepID=UPI0000F3CD8A|nr:N-acetyltransferase [Roseobacter sp. SK209-2-6]EBA14797.1 GCN5-related N-acetyltransferase [Roseobacter sp. SK209-2-6]